jgi:hypothetical protein
VRSRALEVHGLAAGLRREDPEKIELCRPSCVSLRGERLMLEFVALRLSYCKEAKQLAR